MTVYEKIKDLFDSAGVEYKILEHPPVYTSADAAKIRDVTPHMGAKALVCFADKTPILLVLPGDRKADFKKFKKSFGIKDLRMATAVEVKELTTLEVGSIPPVGKVMDLLSYYDSEVVENEDVAFNAGSHTVSIIMKASDLVRVEQPTVSSFVCI